MADKVSSGESGGRTWWRRCGKTGMDMAVEEMCPTYEMWDDGDGEMGRKNGDGLGKYKQGTNTNLRAYLHSRIMGMAENISGEYSDG